MASASGNPQDHVGPVEVDENVGPHSPAAADAARSGYDVTEDVFRERAADVQATERAANEAPPSGQSTSPHHPPSR